VAIPDVSDRSLAELIRLDGKVAVVTGGARGLGKAISRRLAEAGAAVVIADLDVTGAEATAKDLAKVTGGTLVAQAVDVTDADSVAALGQGVVEELGGLDIWVNNAGIYPTTEVLEMDTEEWDRVVGINLRGTFLGSREAAKRMVEQGRGGVIINLSSTCGYRAFGPGLAHYTASKHAIRGLTKSLAIELGPHGIRALALAPTLIVTEGIAESRDEHEESGLAEAQDALLTAHPLRRLGVPDDVARVALFCASDLSLLMTGSTLSVDAGFLAL
jgi:NAD(P)-dependent dehydrogenase (short-subunit alcohol dehydrogenase family)